MCSAIVVCRPRPAPRKWTATRSPLRNNSMVWAVMRVELLTDQPVRHRVIVPVDVDVIIGRDAADPPLGIFVRLGGERLERRAIEFQEQIAAADAEAAHWPRVEIDNQLGDRLVQLAEREETAV